MQELDHKRAFQVHCLAQIGVTTWLSVDSAVSGTVFYPTNPWPMDQAFEPISEISTTDCFQGFDVAEVTPKVVAPEKKERSVVHSLEKLNVDPDIIVEDLQLIEEHTVDVNVPVQKEVLIRHKVVRLDLHAFALSNQLLILSEMPASFVKQKDIECLVIKMSQLLLKQSIDEWSINVLSWPGGLKNPHFLARQDWLLGALESFVQRVSESFLAPPKLVLAGASIGHLFDELSSDNPLKSLPAARIVSLSELYHIPKLRKEAWQTMQTVLF